MMKSGLGGLAGSWVNFLSVPYQSTVIPTLLEAQVRLYQIFFRKAHHTEDLYVIWNA